MTKKKIVLYQPQQVNEGLGLPSTKDMLPLEMLTPSLRRLVRATTVPDMETAMST